MVSNMQMSDVVVMEVFSWVKNVGLRTILYMMSVVHGGDAKPWVRVGDHVHTGILCISHSAGSREPYTDLISWILWYNPWARRDKLGCDDLVFPGLHTQGSKVVLKIQRVNTQADIDISESGTHHVHRIFPVVGIYTFPFNSFITNLFPRTFLGW